MRKRGHWLTISIAAGLVALIGIGVRGSQPEGPKPLTAADVIKLWEPKLEGVEDFQSFDASPKECPAVAAGTFRVVGPSFERACCARLLRMRSFKRVPRFQRATKMLFGITQWTFFSVSEIAPTRQSMATLARP